MNAPFELRQGDKPFSLLVEQYEAIMTSAAFRLAPEKVFVHLTGADRVSFLHGTCSQDIKSLTPGTVAYGLFLTDRAHVLADFYVYTLENELLLETQRDIWPQARAQLERLIVADDVELNEDTTLISLELYGPKRADVLSAVLQVQKLELPDWRLTKQDNYIVANSVKRGIQTSTVIGPEDALRDLVGKLYQNASGLPVKEVSYESLEIVRVENGIASVGFDTDAKTLALEARLEAGISFNKGCYLGQETIERVSAHGHLKRRLYGLKISGDKEPARGAIVKLGDVQVGQISSVVRSPELGLIALGILHHSAWKPGTEVEVHDQVGHYKAIVNDLPFIQTHK